MIQGHIIVVITPDLGDKETWNIKKQQLISISKIKLIKLKQIKTTGVKL